MACSRFRAAFSTAICSAMVMALLWLGAPGVAQQGGTSSSAERRESLAQGFEERSALERRILPRHHRLEEPRLLGDDRLRPLPPAVRPPEPRGVERRILADGTFETRYPDGSIHRQRPNGSVEMVAPDGTVTVALPIQVPSAELPRLPDTLADWGGILADQLLGLLVNLLSEDEFAAYRQTETEKGFYELIDWRLRSLHFLTMAN